MKDVWIEFRSTATGQPVRLHALWAEAERPGAPVLLYLHGARWDVRGSAYRVLRWHRLGFSVLALDYRGFGLSSEDLPSEETAYEDARAAWDWLARQHPGARRYVFGHSLGGAIAVHLAAEAPDVNGLIVEGSFTSIPDVFRHLKWGWLPLEPLITQRFEAARRIDRVRAPVLVVHGSEDRLIPHELGRALYERAPGPQALRAGGRRHAPRHQRAGAGPLPARAGRALRPPLRRTPAPGPARCRRA